MGVLHLGPSGAALGTTLSQTVSVIVALTMFMKGKNRITVKKSDFKPRKETMGRLLKIGFPIAMQDGLIQVAFIIITIIANRRGLTDAAAVGIVEKVISFLFLVPSSMLSTVSALGAQNVGAGKPERAAATLKYAICIAGGFGLIIAIIIQFTAGNVVNLFTNDQAVVYAGAKYLKGYIWDCMFAGIHFSFSGYFCACGRSGYSFIHNITSIALVRVPGVYLTSKISGNIISNGTGNSGWFFYVGCVLYRVIPSFAETETTGERYIEIQTLQCNKKVLRNQTKSDTPFKGSTENLQHLEKRRSGTEK